MPELCLTVRFALQPEHFDEAVALLHQLRHHTRQEPGNLAYDLYRSTEQPDVVFLYERYVDQAGLDAHRASAHFERYGKNGFFRFVTERRAELYTPVPAPTAG